MDNEFPRLDEATVEELEAELDFRYAQSERGRMRALTGRRDPYGRFVRNSVAPAPSAGNPPETDSR